MTEEDILYHLHWFPNDWYYRLIAADWWEENGQPQKANGQRWQVLRRKYPDKKRGYPCWTWFVNNARKVNSCHRLSDRLLIVMDGDQRYPGPLSWSFSSLGRAEQALASALEKLEIHTSTEEACRSLGV